MGPDCGVALHVVDQGAGALKRNAAASPIEDNIVAVSDPAHLQFGIRLAEVANLVGTTVERVYLPLVIVLEEEVLRQLIEHIAGRVDDRDAVEVGWLGELVGDDRIECVKHIACTVKARADARSEQTCQVGGEIAPEEVAEEGRHRDDFVLIIVLHEQRVNLALLLAGLHEHVEKDDGKGYAAFGEVRLDGEKGMVAEETMIGVEVVTEEVRIG